MYRGQKCRNPHRLPYRSRPLLNSSRLVLPTERFLASRTFQPLTLPQTSESLAHSTTSKPTIKTQSPAFSEHREEEESRQTQPPAFPEHTEEEEETRQTQPASCALRPQSLVSAELSPALKPTMQTQHPHFSERRTTADLASCRTSTWLLKTDSDSSRNSEKESAKSSESDQLESCAVESVKSLSLESCGDLGSLCGEAADMADPLSLQVEEGRSPTAGEDEVLASDITLSDEECLPEILACLDWSTLSDEDDSCTLTNSLSEYVSLTEPELKCQAKTDTFQSDIFKECDVNRCENVEGVRMRASHFEVLGAGRRRGNLKSVSEPQPVLIRARGPNNLFLISDNNNLPSMSFINENQAWQAVFHKQEFFDEILCEEFTSFCHLPSKSYLGISADTKDVTFVRVASSDSEDGYDAFVVSLNGPTRPAIAPEMPEDVSQGPDLSCLFVVTSDGYDSLQPALCQNKSLDIDDCDNSLKVVDGCRWSFNLLSADQVRKFIPKADLKKLLKKCQLAVLVICRSHRH